jgi:hypothetical protein
MPSGPDVGGAARRTGCLQTCAAARTPIRRRMFFEAYAWLSDGTARGPFARLAGRSDLRLSVTRSESNPIACVTAYVNGVCNYPPG